MTVIAVFSLELSTSWLGESNERGQVCRRGYISYGFANLSGSEQRQRPGNRHRCAAQVREVRISDGSENSAYEYLRPRCLVPGSSDGPMVRPGRYVCSRRGWQPPSGEARPL